MRGPSSPATWSRSPSTSSSRCPACRRASCTSASCEIATGGDSSRGARVLVWIRAYGQRRAMRCDDASARGRRLIEIRVRRRMTKRGGTVKAMATVTRLHDAVKRGDLATLRTLLDGDRNLANAVSETDPRLTYPLHVAAEFGQAEAARVLLGYGADPSLVDVENDATALGWAAFFGRPSVVAVLLEAGSELNHRNKHGLTPLDCALGGSAGRWTQFSNATVDDWRRAAKLISDAGGKE